MRLLLSPLLFLLLLLPTTVPHAFASDGSLEINQACATQTGCFPGDALGFPVTITAPGSYRLTSSLGLSLALPGQTQSVNFIEIRASDVSIDLAGFRISCVRPLVAERCSGTGSGIRSFAVRTPAVRNGIVSGMGAEGIVFGEAGVVTNVRVSDSGSTGIVVGEGGRIQECTVFRNEEGIRTGLAAFVANNAVSRNVETGIVVQGGVRVVGNSVSLNGGDGIFAEDEVHVADNTVWDNFGNGIVASGRTTVERNQVSNSSGFGLSLNGALYRDNTITTNSSGAVSGGTNLGGNYCEGTNVSASTCP